MLAPLAAVPSTIIRIRLRQQLLHAQESPLEIGCLNRAQLQVQEGRQAGSDPGMNPASVDIGDQTIHRVPNGHRVVQGWQWIRVFVR